MARSRVVKPEFFDDEKLSTVSRDARLTFIGLWVNGDDYGVVKGNHVWLKNRIFPYDDIKKDTFDKWVGELDGIKVILPFYSNGESYYFIRHFLDHQKVNRPSEKRNPAPPPDILSIHKALSESSLSNHGALIDETETERETETETEREDKSKSTNHSRFSFDEWGEHINTSFDLLLSDRKWLDTMIERYPRTNIPATIEEAREYWAGYEGYEKKKGSKNCNWKTTLQNTFKADWLKVPKDISRLPGKQNLKSSSDDNGLHQQYQQARQAAYDKFKSTLNLDELWAKFRDDWLKKDPNFTRDFQDWEERLERHFQHKLAGHIEGEVDFPSFDQWKARGP